MSGKDDKQAKRKKKAKAEAKAKAKGKGKGKAAPEAKAGAKAKGRSKAKAKGKTAAEGRNKKTEVIALGKPDATTRKAKRQRRSDAGTALLERACPCCSKRCLLAKPRCGKGRAVRAKLLERAAA